MKRKYNKTIYQKLHKDFCEIEGCDAPKETLHWHHIIERTVVGTSNDPYNLAVLCSNCHNLCHDGIIEIIGVYPSTNKYGRKLIYKKNGVANVKGIEEPYFKPQLPKMKLYLKEKNEESEGRTEEEG